MKPDTIEAILRATLPKFNEGDYVSVQGQPDYWLIEEQLTRCEVLHLSFGQGAHYHYLLFNPSHEHRLIASEEFLELVPNWGK